MKELLNRLGLCLIVLSISVLSGAFLMTASAIDTSSVKPTKYSSTTVNTPANAYDAEPNIIGASWNSTTGTADFYGMGFSIPANVSIDDVAIYLRGVKTNSSSISGKLQVSISHDGGTTFSSTQSYVFGSATSTVEHNGVWGQSGLTNSDFNTADNFRIRIAQTESLMDTKITDMYVIVTYTYKPTVTQWPTASTITYGQSLSASTLTGGSASVPGTFSFGAPPSVPDAGANQIMPAIFTPTDTVTYGRVIGSINITVNKATPTVSVWSTANPITYGQALGLAYIPPGSASVPGIFYFTNLSTVPNAGVNQSFTGVFTPDNTANYNTVSGNISVTVNKATPTVTAWPSASGITYGQAVSASTLTGGTSSVVGTFAFTSPTTVPNIGSQIVLVTFTPTDSTNYNTVSGNISVTVNKATPTVTA